MHKLEQLLERLKQAQRDLVYQAAECEALPTDRMLKKVADLEAGIAATEALIDEERRPPGQVKVRFRRLISPLKMPLARASTIPRLTASMTPAVQERRLMVEGAHGCGSVRYPTSTGSDRTWKMTMK